MSQKIYHWAVEVRVNHKQVLTIESNCVYGKSLSNQEEEVIREAAEHLLAFVGKHAKKESCNSPSKS